MGSGEEQIEVRISRLRAKGEELRQLSDGMKYPATQASMRGLASTFDNFADWLEGRQNPPPMGDETWV